MTLLDRLQAHKGGLVRIKTQLFWFGSRGWDGNPERLCLLLDAADADIEGTPAATTATATPPTSALLLIDGAPHWVWMAEADVELLDGAPQ